MSPLPDIFYKHARHMVSAGGGKVHRGKSRTLKWPKILSPIRQNPHDLMVNFTDIIAQCTNHCRSQK
jgi:hypothetical protein